MAILVLTRSDDSCAAAVLDRIQERGGRAFRFDTDRFPTEIRAIVEYSNGSRRIRVESGDNELDLAQVTAVWHRRLYVGGLLPKEMDKQLRSASQLECRATLQGMVASLQCFHLDPVPSIRHAQNKQLQLQRAAELGLAVPRTLITNDPDSVRSFFAACRGEVIAKMLSTFAIYEEGEERVVFTNPVVADDLEHLDSLKLCPMTFQEKIPKALELRTILIGDREFTASIDSQAYERSRIDWRRDAVARLDAWRAYALPDEVRGKLRALLRSFGLLYGAFDLILTPDQRYVFLEVNPSGEFFWLERFAQLPISGAIADVLLRCPRSAG
jgi:hypothetical protein